MSVSRTNDSCYGVAGLAAEVTHELVLVGRLDEQVAVVAGNLAAPPWLGGPWMPLMAPAAAPR